MFEQCFRMAKQGVNTFILPSNEKAQRQRGADENRHNAGCPSPRLTNTEGKNHKLYNKKAQLTQELRTTAVRVYRHLGFLKFESCIISLAVPETPTLEPNSMSIGKLVAKLWPFLYIQDGRQPPFWILSNRKYRHSIRLSRKP